MQKNKLVRKVMSGVSGLALLVGLEGCGTTIQHLDPKTSVWYDCNTNEDYPVGHPCYDVIDVKSGCSRPIGAVRASQDRDSLSSNNNSCCKQLNCKAYGYDGCEVTGTKMATPTCICYKEYGGSHEHYTLDNLGINGQL